MITHPLLSKKSLWLFLLIAQLLMCSYGLMPAQAMEPDGEVSMGSSQLIASDSDTEQEQATEAEQATEPAAPASDGIENTAVNIDIIQQTLESLRSEIENSKESTNLNKGSVQAMKDGLDLIENKLKDAYEALDQSRTGISVNTKTLEEFKQSLLGTARDVRTNSSELSSQKSLIEDNSISLYELLIQLDTVNQQVKKFIASIRDSENDNDNEENSDIKLATSSDLKKIWIIVVTALVFLTPLAFSFPWQNDNNDEQSIDTTNQQQNIILICCFAMLGYFTVGFSLMYGSSASGWLGMSYLLPGNSDSSGVLAPMFSVEQFMPYQAGFVVLATLIIQTTLGAKLSLLKHALLAFFVGALLIPVFGHWAWASRFTTGNKGWLEGASFVDQAGSTVISVVAACFALVVLYKLSRRTSNPTPAVIDLEQGRYPIYSATAVLFLWLSWLGFTTGSLSLSDGNMPAIALNTLMAALFAGITAAAPYAFSGQEKISITRGLAGFVSGLVAIAACGQSVTFMEAAVIGLGAGILQNLLFNFLRKLLLPHDHQIRAAYLITIHGVAGIWGTLCVALFSSDGSFSAFNIIQLVTQLQGIAAAIAYSIVMAYLATFLLTLGSQRTKTKKPG